MDRATDLRSNGVVQFLLLAMCRSDGKHLTSCCHFAPTCQCGGYLVEQLPVCQNSCGTYRLYSSVDDKRVKTYIYSYTRLRSLIIILSKSYEKFFLLEIVRHEANYLQLLTVIYYCALNSHHFVRPNLCWQIQYLQSASHV